MTVREFAEQYGCRIYCMPDEDREIKGGYAGDLLSWVMGRLSADHAWVTIMSNVNIVAVATLTDPSCIILSDGVVPEEDVISIVYFPNAKAIKATIVRPLPSGALGERDVYGAQQHAPLVNFTFEI